ncbi:MAG: FAD-binding oxidoreductase [Chloroflexi bacterium]|nr:FAD-binding oxidoreductase [Chloroflexota bacterium]MBI2983987.1 FAD-binding oxidoreductase [Chloroflexota bacterium]
MPGAAQDVVIVGGGVIGASIAYHLTARGVRSVLVLERETLGAGSTGKNAGGIRLQFSSEVNVRLSQLSLPRFERFEDEFGIDIAFQQVGYLFLITEERDIPAFQRSLALWQRLGVPARKVEVDEIRSIFPELAVHDVLFGTFCGKDGHADPMSILNGFVARARAAGATFREHAAVSGIDLERGRVRAVHVGDERIACDLVIDAAGAWAPQIAAMVGVVVPIRPLRRHIFVTDNAAGIDHPIPLTIEFASTLYMHRESGGILLGMADPNDRPTYSETVNWDFLPAVVERGLARLPLLERTSVRTGWAGLYEDTPDKHPILGCVDGVEGFVMAAGFSGHGLMHAPAVGAIIADRIVGRPSSFDIAPLRLARFNTGEPVREHNVI